MKERLLMLIIPLLIIFYSCESESEESIKPIIRTNEVTNIEVNSASFNGEIIELGTFNIIDYGFVWDTISTPDIQNSNILSLGIPNNTGEFSAIQSFGISNIYYVRTYIQISNEVIYGETTSFETPSIWKRIDDHLGESIYHALGFSINGVGYIGLGRSINTNNRLTEMWKYDPQEENWQPIKAFPGESRTSGIAFSVGGKGYIGLGFNGSYFKDIWEYNPDNDKWIRKNDFEGGPRAYMASFTIDKFGYVGMGDDQNNNFWKYDASLDTWTTIPSLPGEELLRTVSFSLSNKGYIITGGTTTPMVLDGISTTARKAVWEYDALIQSWSQLEDFPGAARVSAAGFVINDRAYLGTAGSILKNNQIVYTNDFWRFDPMD